MRADEDVIAGPGARRMQRSVDAEALELGREDSDRAVVVGIEIGEAALDAAAGDAEEPAVAQDAKLAPSGWLRAVHQEVGELGLDGSGRLRLGRDMLEEGVLELGDPLARRGRAAERRSGGFAQRVAVLRRDEVDLREHDELRPPGQPAAVEGELTIDRPSPLVDLLGAGRGVDQVDEQPRALEVREELVSQADSLARTLQEARARPPP